ncbi:MAG: fibronectin type III domain-containing protein [Saprospiraceae bacterium]|nr:fibronectin type III domain-containing protein [Saprospiraceae bacterium]
MYKIILIYVALHLTLTIESQTIVDSLYPPKSENAAIIGKSIDKGILLRWGPTKFSIWQYASYKGWKLERAELDDLNFETEKNSISYKEIGRFKAMTKDEWEKNLDINQVEVAIAAQSLFGDKSNEKPAEKDFGNLLLTSELQGNRHAMAMFAADLSADASIGLGLRYHDKDVTSDRYYIYRLTIEKNKEGFGGDTVYFHRYYDGTDDFKPEVQDVRCISEHGKVRIEWEKNFNSKYYTAFHIERSEDKQSFTRLSDLPVTSSFDNNLANAHIFTDTTAVLDKVYYYKVIGITPFADRSISESFVEGVAKDLQGPIPPVDIVIEQLNEHFRLSWNMPDSLMMPDLKGWIVKKSDKASGPFTEVHDKVLPVSQKTYTDTNPIPVFTNYYCVYAIDYSGNETPGMVYGAVWFDDTPPVAPVHLRSKVDTTGFVFLTWNPNTEIDLMGYRVFARQDENKEWYQLTDRPIYENAFIDSLAVNTLSKSIEYTVIATDLHYNVSEYAKALVVVLPDLVRPSAPRWNKWYLEKNHIFLEWYPSSADDIKVHRLLRQNPNQSWSLMKDLNPGTNFYKEILEGGKTGSYALLAIDEAGNASDTVFLKNIHNTHAEKLAGVHKVKVKFDEKEQTILLSWEYPAKTKVTFQLYRKSLETEDTELVGSFDSDTRKFTDKGPTDFKKGFSYHFKVIGQDKQESEWSEAYKVVYAQ